MSPFVPNARTNATHTLLDVDQYAEQPTASAPTTMQRTVFILCIVFGSLLGCVLIGTVGYYTRRYIHRRQLDKEERLRRDASFLVGAPSTYRASAPLTTPAFARRSRRPSARPRPPRATSINRLAIPSLELGSVFRIDPASMRRASSATTVAPIHEDSPPMPERPLPPRVTSPRRQPLSSNDPIRVGQSSPPAFDRYHVPLRTINPPLTSLHAPTITTQLQKPNPVYRASPSPSRERLVGSTASADSLASTPPLSPEATSHSQRGTPMTTGPAHVITPVPSIQAMRKTLSKQSMSSLEYTPFVLPAVQEQDPRLPRPPSPPVLNRARSADEVLRGSRGVGTPVTLSHFPFRFSHTGNASSPGLASVRSGSGGGRQSPPSAFMPQRHGGPGLNTKASAWTLPHTAPPLKLKIRHVASDEIIAIAFAPHTITFAAVCDAVRTRLGFRPRRVLRDDNVQISDDDGLWSWMDEQYTKGHTRLMLQVE